MASIRKAKKLGIYVPKKKTAKQRALYKETLELASKANRRLKGLKSGGYQGSWASKKLVNRIDNDVLKGWTKAEGGKIKVQKNLTATQLTNLQKSIRQFLNSKTSKVKGILQTREATIKSLRASLSLDQQHKLSYEDAEYYYDMLGDNDFDYFNEKIGASTMWSLTEDAIEAGDTEKSWIKRLSKYMTLNDKDVVARAKRLYEKYVL